ncbi:MAG: SURF1 family protein [Pseudomonadota bacterium]
MLRSLIAALGLGLAGTAILVALGVWQLQRLEWKQGVLSQIEARIGSAPVALPDMPEPGRDTYLPVQVSGETGENEILVQASRKLVGPGFRVIVPFETGGRRILLDRGFISAADRDAARPPVALTVLGNLHWPDEVDGFTPDPDREAMLWFARDVDQMAEALGTEPVLLIARVVEPSDPKISPLPIDTAGIPNNHLEYAITWFLLAIVWAGMTVYLLVRIRRQSL